MEKDVFKRRIIRFDQLESFGFVATNEGYVYERKLCDGLIARVSVSPQGDVTGKVFDTDFGEEYVNHRQEQVTGAFVVGVKNAYLALLEEIAQATTVPQLYLGDQANRLNDYIFEKYGVSPEFMWSKFPHYGVYRNSINRKWFAIVMNLDKSKLNSALQGEADVMNVKPGDRVREFIEKGAYPCYHMNHKNWVSVILDGSLTDDLVKEMVDLSFAMVANDSKRQNKKRVGAF